MQPLHVFALLELGIGAFWRRHFLRAAAPRRALCARSAARASRNARARGGRRVLPAAAHDLDGCDVARRSRAALPATPHGCRGSARSTPANIAGAVIGSLLAGFYLLRVHDAASPRSRRRALNAAAACARLAIARHARLARRALDRVAPRAAASRASHAAGLRGDRAVRRRRRSRPRWSGRGSLSLLFGGTVYAFALILAVFLLGLGLGSAAGTRGSRGAVDARAWRSRLCQWLAGRHGVGRVLRSTCVLAVLAARSRRCRRRLVRLCSWTLSARGVGRLAGGAGSGARAFRSRSRRRRMRREDPAPRSSAASTQRTRRRDRGALARQPRARGTTRQPAPAAARDRRAASAALLLLVPARRRTRRRAALVAGTIVLGGAVALAAIVRRAAARARRVRPVPSDVRGVGANVLYVGEGLTASIAVSRRTTARSPITAPARSQASSHLQDMRLQRMLGHSRDADRHPDVREASRFS